MGQGLRRMSGWEVRLDLVVDAARAEPFVWGRSDCFTFVCECIEALTGEDRAAPWRGRYATERESLRLMAKHGHSLRQAGDWFFGSEAISARQARRGDAVLFQSPDGRKPLGICLGAMSAARSFDGLVFLPTVSAVLAWRVG